MEWTLGRRWYTLALTSVALSLAYLVLRRDKRTKSQEANSVEEESLESNMAAAEVENSSSSAVEAAHNPISVSESELVQSVKELKVEPQRVNEEAAELPDRDSANHSPSDFLLGNNHSDTHSEGSNDSGKGGSDCPNNNGEEEHAPYDASSPTPNNPLAPAPERLFVYEFEVPQTLCGLLIGRYGAYIHQIKAKTGASMLVKKHPTNKRYKLCAIEGTKSEIDAALAAIRAKFPLKRYPQITLTQLNAPTPVPVLPDSIQLQLPAEVCCEVMVSALIGTNHMFVQEITHPTYPSLTRLDTCMTQCYSEFQSPPIPSPVQPGMVCAAPYLGGWYRAKIVAVYDPVLGEAAQNDEKDAQVKAKEGETSDKTEKSNASSREETGDIEADISFVDYGGYARVPVSSLRQVRADFMTLPFQAIECLLANVAPLKEEDGWSMEAFAYIEEMTRNQILHAQLVGYTMEGLPLIYLYQISTEGAVLINKELVSRGFAVWVEPEIIVSAEENN